MRTLLACCLAGYFALVVAACGDDAATPDASPIVADAPTNQPDAPSAPTLDGSVDAPVAPADAPAPLADADPTLPDARPDAVTMPTTCTRVCETLELCITMMANPECVAQCNADLADCTAAQVMQIETCNMLGCPGGDPSAFGACMMMVGCVMPGMP
ncbi:MAG: hypothetical protein EXR73_06450 [Myxococcales bacterium]|nr:hypothetical protein [Myxococcales bacterium]